MKNQLKEISIRGRYAIGVSCIKLLLRERELHHTEFSRILIKKLGAFTQYKKMDIWEEEIKAYLPYDHTSEEIIADLQKFNAFCKSYQSTRDKNWYKGVNLEILEASFYNELITFYKAPENKTIKQVAELCNNIGGAELYGAMSKDNSKMTLKYLIEILDLTQLTSEFNFEKIAKNHSFSKKEGWGEVFNYKSFERK